MSSWSKIASALRSQQPKLSFGLLLAALLLSTSACGERLRKLEGEYYGDLSVIEHGRVVNHRVTTKITSANRKSKSRIEIEVNILNPNGTKGALLTLISLRKSDDDIIIDSQLLPSVPGRKDVRVRDRGACGQEEPGAARPSLTMICATDQVISLFATNLSGSYRSLLYMSKTGAPVNPSTLPPGGRFTLAEIHKRVREASYENRLAAEKLYQAREEVKLVRSRLVPSITLGSVVNAAQGGLNLNGPMAIANTIGNLVPFIFPSAWYDLSAQKAFYQAQVLSYKSLIANQMNLVSDMYHEILRDQLVLGRLRVERGRLTDARAVVAEMVAMGLAPESDLLEFDDMIAQNDNSQSQARHLVNSQIAILSKGIGLSAREGIRSLETVALPASSSFSKIDSNKLVAGALAASLELQEILYLEREATQKKSSTTWSFLNPAGWIGFNIGIFHEVSIAGSRIREVRLLREQAEQQIIEQVVTVASLHNRLVEQNQILDRQIAKRLESLATIRERYALGGASILEVRAASESLLRLEAEKTEAETAHALVRGKIDRLLMRGPYQPVLTMKVGK